MTKFKHGDKIKLKKDAAYGLVDLVFKIIECYPSSVTVLCGKDRYSLSIDIIELIDNNFSLEEIDD